MGSTVEDWPFGLEELEPYYDKVEYEIGVSGKAGNINGKIDAQGNIFEGRRREYRGRCPVLLFSAIRQQTASIACCKIPPMLDDGVWAEIKVGDEHLRLFSEHNAQGVQTSVYNVRTKQWIAPSESVDDIEDGKERAVQYAREYLRCAADMELPPLHWKDARSK
jgi:hypothetical protein